MDKVNTFEKEKSEIEEIRKEIDSLTAPLYEKITKLQEEIDKCVHPISHIVEGEYSPDDYGWGSADPPFRVCTICGYAEEGWGCGYWKLAPRIYDIKPISRNKAYTYVTKGVLSQEKLSNLKFKKS